jgi:lipopolysaccharide/colanic/teichoic acid biosynthesis glycosyltransferase
LRPPVFEGVDYAVKRTFDLVISSLLLLLLSPVLLAIAVAVKLSSRGPVIYRSVRPGMAGIPFSCLKFRTMREHAEHAQDDLEAFNELSGALFKIRNDPRLTPAGRILRRFSLDELPQLVNVIRGEMSLVGPRPEQLDLVERYASEHQFRLAVKPGITGPMQVYGRGELTFEERLAVEREYVENLSLVRDFRILLLTLPAVFGRRGAY